MQTPILTANSISNVSTSSSRFFSISPGGSTGGAGSLKNETPMPIAGTLKNLTFGVPTTVSAGSYTVTVLKNGSATALTCAISSGTTAQDTTHSVSVVAGDRISIQLDPASTPTTEADVYISLMLDGTTSGESLVLNGLMSLPTTAVTVFGPVGYADNVSDSTETNKSVVFPTAGTIDQFYVNTSSAPGTSNSWAFTVNQNGSPTSLTCTVANAATTANDTNGAHAITVAAGDTLSIKVVTVGTPGANIDVMSGMRFVPTTNGESVMMSRTSQGVSAGSTTFMYTGGSSPNDTTENTYKTIAPIAFTWKKEYVIMNTAPGAGTSRDFTSRIGGVSKALTVSLSAGTTGNDTTHTVSVNALDILDWASVPANSPAGSTGSRVGAVMLISPSVATNSNFFDFF